VARNDLGKLQPLREALQQLWQEGLTRVHLLRTFFSRFGAIPLSRGIASARVGMLDPVLAIFTILSFHGTSNFARGHGGSRNEPWEATSPEDAPRREAKRTPGEEMWAWREREREREIFMPSDRRCEGGVGAPPRPGSSSEREVESEGRHCLPHLP
jgi:hypothetical protein